MLVPRQPMPEVEGVDHLYVNAAGLRMHVAVAGPEDGEPVLLQHGWPQHWWMWRHAVPSLSERYRVYMPDLRGFGWSEAVGGTAAYGRYAMADDMFALIDALEIDQPIKLGGHDWGGWIGFLMALQRPELFERFIALNIPPVWGKPGPFDLKVSLRSLKRLGYQIPLSTPGLSQWITSGGGRNRLEHGMKVAAINPDTWGGGVIETYLDQFKDPARARATMYLYRRFFTREVPLIAAQKYVKGRLKVPTRLLFGMEDVAVDPLVILADHSSMADDLTVETVDDCGHFIIDEQPALVADRIAGWFAGQPAAASLAST